jgi:hypothetical protein
MMGYWQNNNNFMNIEAIKMHVKVKVTGKKRDAAP